MQSSSTVGGQLRDQNMLDSLSDILKVELIAAGEETEITHQFDAWHFAKKIMKKTDAVSKNKSCNVLQK